MRFQPLLDVVPGEFVGKNADEAVGRARGVLGAEAKIRCWKTRRGGILGFFAREVYVAGVDEPTGGHEQALRRAKEPPALLRERTVESTSIALDDLVARTTDEVSCASYDETASERAFRDVLAQAEAALSDAACDDAWPVEGASEVTDAPDLSVGADRDNDELEAFRGSLGALGLAASFRPLEGERVFEGLVTALGKLPVAPMLPKVSGSIIAVVGTRREARAVAEEIATHFDLEERDVFALFDDPDVRRQLVRRRNSTRISVVVLESTPRARMLDESIEQLAWLRPDYVLGAVPATLKCADVERWRHELGIEALALRRWDHTETPAEWLAAFPILSVDGVVMSRLHWVSLLLATHLTHRERQ
ncbi:MAG: hypothetical protein WCA31_08125 [Acidimicrobiales bacterium]